MIKKVTILSFVLSVLCVGFVMAQPVPIVEPVRVDTTLYNGIYRGVQNQIYCDPTTGNLVVAWYRYNSTDPDPRKITAATSIDGGATWQIHEMLNFGVGPIMDARYASVCGISTTPIVAYEDRNASVNKTRIPVVATDVAGWGGGAFVNYFIDDVGTADTVLHSSYLSIAVSPEDENIWGVGGWHTGEPGDGLYYYVTKDAGMTWSRPKVPISEDTDDVGKSNYVFDFSSRGLGVGMGPNNTVMVSAGAKLLETDIWTNIYCFSDDLGQTWTAPAVIPGAETLYNSDADNYRNFSSPMVDGAGNWHIFAVSYDTLESDGTFPVPYYGYDFRFDGSTWDVTKIAIPTLLPNGIAAWGDWPSDVEEYEMNEPAIGPDGTLYYAYFDVVDTTGAMGDEANFNYNIMVIYSDDNGSTWHGPVSVLDQWSGHAPNGMAKYATDKLHILYRHHTEDADMGMYLGVPTDTVKARATRVKENVTTLTPESFQLHQNYPNPFNPTTSITFDLTERAHVTLKVFNEMGQEVATVIDKPMDAGFKGVTWNAANLPSGVYFYQLTAGSMTQSKRMVLMK
ncbi:MAG: T9SS type A sorting domain-containing protein [Candidatus Zhuqueibacterota bacterium]